MVRSKLPVRNNIKKDKKRSKRLKILQFIFKITRFLFMVAFLGGVLYSFYTYINIRNVKIADTLSDSRSLYFPHYSGLEKTIFIFKENDKIEEIYLLFINPKDASVLIFYIPPAVYIPCPEASKQAKVPTENLIYTGDVITNDHGEEYAIWRIQKYLAVNLDSYLIIDTSAYTYTEPTLPFFKHSIEESEFENLTYFITDFTFPQVLIDPEEAKNILRESKSNLSTAEILSKAHFIKRSIGNSAREVIIVNILEDGLTVESVNESNEIVQQFNYKAFDQTMRNNAENVLRSEEIVEEQARIEVYNGSGLTGAAGTYARMVNNVGLDLIRYGNAPNSVEETYIFVSDEEKYGDSLDYMQSFFDNPVKVKVERPDFMNTGDIILVLGEDISKSFVWD